MTISNTLSRRKMIKGSAAIAVTSVALPALAKANNDDSELFAAIEECKRLLSQISHLETKWSSIHKTMPPDYIVGYGRKWRRQEDIPTIVKYNFSDNDARKIEVENTEAITKLKENKRNYKGQYQLSGLANIDKELEEIDGQERNVWQFIKDYQIKTNKGLIAKMKYILNIVDDESELCSILIADAERLI